MNHANQQAPRDIHLLTTDVLLSDLVDGREVMVAGGAAFSLGTDDSRSVLEWYRRNASKWARNLSGDDIEAIIDAAGEKPPAINNDGTISRETHVKRSLRLVRLTAHRFAGLHAYGSSTEAPETFTFVTSKDATLFEGANGSGKTSILNAIVWCLTGEIIRSQRAPEPGSTEFACEITRPDGSVSTHQMSSVTPMPNGNSELPVDGQPIPADTWVELIFADADGTNLPPLRRAQTRNSRGKLQETGPDLDAVGVDPIAWRIATSMPAILPFLSVGSTSHLGQAVARLTGLADLVDLAKHATKAAERISKRSVKEIEQEIDGIANRYGEAREDLEAVISEYNEIGFPGELPSILADDGRERLASIAKHFVDSKAEALAEARTVLGDGFNPEDKSSRDDLEGNIQPAIAELQHIQKLPSFARFLALSADAEEQKKVNDLLETVGREAEVLAELAAAPDRAARARLYALVSVWIHEHEHSHRDHCPLCAGDLRDAYDPITGVPVTTHLAEAERDRDLVAQTVAQWASGWHARLTKELPDAIANEVRQELPDRPADLLITAMTTELFATESFKGSLSALADDAALLVKERAAQLPEFQEPTERSMPPNIVELVRELLMLMQRIDRAISFARWRAENRVTLQKFIFALRHGEDGAADADRAIGRRLSRLRSIVESVAPLNSAATFVDRMEARRGEREKKQKRIALCRRAATALELLMPLGALAQTQVDDLRTKLETRTDFWRRAIFLNATTYAPDLTGTVMDAKGTLGLQVGRDGVNAPAQHISNASALRGALFGFFLAFREYVLTQRGGVQTLVLDDPQELLDNDNRERLARGLCQVAGDAQLIVTSHDRKFARCLVAEHREKVEHLSVHPVNGVHPTVFVAPAQEEIVRKRKAFLDNPDNHALAQDYASETLLHISVRGIHLGNPDGQIVGMPKPANTRYRTTNWSDYNASLKRRGSLSVWFDPEMPWQADRSGKRGHPETFSDSAIQTCLTLKVLFGLPLRQTVGLVASLIEMAGLDWPVPDYSTLCRRQARIQVQIPYRRSGQPLNLLIDSTGIRFRGDGEWLSRKHGATRRREWRKVHLAMDTTTGDIRAVEFTSSRQGDSPILPELLAQIPAVEEIETVTADGAYDTRRCHAAILEHGAEPFIPIRRNGRAWKPDCPAAISRNEILRATRCLGRSIWKKWSGYDSRSRVEAQMNRLKLLGDRIMSRDPDRQTAEIQIRIAIMNRCSALGRAEIEAVA